MVVYVNQILNPYEDVAVVSDDKEVQHVQVFVKMVTPHLIVNVSNLIEVTMAFTQATGVTDSEDIHVVFKQKNGIIVDINY